MYINTNQNEDFAFYKINRIVTLGDQKQHFAGLFYNNYICLLLDFIFFIRWWYLLIYPKMVKF